MVSPCSQYARGTLEYSPAEMTSQTIITRRQGRRSTLTLPPEGL